MPQPFCHPPTPLCSLPFWLIYFIALLVQYVVAPLMHLFGRQLQSDFTPSRIKLSAANRTFSCAAAYRDFGYVPHVGLWQWVCDGCCCRA